MPTINWPAVSGTYAEPGSQTFLSSGRRDQVMAKCRNCGYDIVFMNGPDHGDWRHVVTDEHRCSETALSAPA
jgi:hypothetical protein